ncbi:uncharacterized protein BYT42DRAFT_613730 [Radiomyces spectabilis]|uniref:uncharacterized protein n=1 Tax=Radiomyces spectabilis TaxID=64574 RepID=UPI00221F0E96|nr:uncharacterized protein BYT42DRAFT_613730 [Radiomyces spectabilis]KAI8379420.1 hypothetical protein BYT42DRAFT_613730 [Radiomyces spectabilis]
MEKLFHDDMGGQEIFVISTTPTYRWVPRATPGASYFTSLDLKSGITECGSKPLTFPRRRLIPDMVKYFNRINYDQKLWSDIFEHADLVRRNKDEDKLQGFQVMDTSSTECDQGVLRSVQHDSAISKRDEDTNTTENNSSTSDNNITETIPPRGEMHTTNVMNAAPKIQCPAPNRDHIGDVDVSMLFYAF